jgi:hypothetical protein
MTITDTPAGTTGACRAAVVDGGDAVLARALGDWRHLTSRRYLAARDYTAAVAAEADALSAVAMLTATGAPHDEVTRARTVLAGVMADRDTAGQRLGLPPGLPAADAHAAEDLLTAARTARHQYRPAGSPARDTRRGVA